MPESIWQVSVYGQQKPPAKSRSHRALVSDSLSETLLEEFHTYPHLG